jgi:hypothetical protein
MYKNEYATIIKAWSSGNIIEYHDEVKDCWIQWPWEYVAPPYFGDCKYRLGKGLYYYRGKKDDS